MKECKDCEFSGYSRQLCILHTKSCERNPELAAKTLPPPVKIGAKAVAGAGVGIAAAVFGVAAVGLVGSVAILHGALIKLGIGAGLAGGGVGLFKGIAENRNKEENGKTDDDALQLG
jgi:hypothetical protein